MEPPKKKFISMDLRTCTRSKGLANGRENSLPIPIDIIILIFSKLDLKSIARCRCVSKLWASTLRHPDFTELFLSLSCSSSPKLLFACQKEGELFFFSSPQPQNPDENSARIVFNYQTKFSFSGYRFVGGRLTANCETFNLVHGLVCLRDLRLFEKEGTVLKICNPSTGQTLILPEVKTGSGDDVWIALGYDPIGKLFKVLAMTQRSYDEVCEEFQVLTLGGETLSWRKIECCIPLNLPRKYICINGVLYYICIDSPTYTIVCFDIRLEKFSFIKIMENCMRAVCNRTSKLLNYNGKLGLLEFDNACGSYVSFDGENIKFDLWVLENHEKQEWSEQTFAFPIMSKYIIGKIFLKFVGVTKKKEIVFSSNNPCNSFDDLFYLDFEKKTMTRVEIQRTDASIYGIDHIFVDHVEDVKLYGSVFR